MTVVKRLAIDTLIVVNETPDRTDSRDDVISDIMKNPEPPVVIDPAKATVTGETAYKLTIHKDHIDNGVQRYRRELRTRYEETISTEIYFSYTVEINPEFTSNHPDRQVLWQYYDDGGTADGKNYVRSYLRARNGNFYFQHYIGLDPNTGSPYLKKMDLGPHTVGIHKFIFYLKISEDPNVGRVKIWKDGQVARIYENEGLNKIIVPTVGTSNNTYPPEETGLFPNTVIDNGVECSLADYHGRTIGDNSTFRPLNIKWQIGLYHPSGTWSIPTTSLYIYVSNIKWAKIGPGETEQDVLNQLSTTTISEPEPEPEPEPIVSSVSENQFRFRVRAESSISISRLLIDTLEFNHPIALDNQLLIAPRNVVDGDNVGKIYALTSHHKFYNRRYGAALTEDSYRYEILNDDGTFEISRGTGELMIRNATQFTQDKTVSIRISFGLIYYQDINCKVLSIPTVDCIFIDPDFVGTSNGARNAPYTKFRTSGHGTGTAGKSYFYKRGSIITNDWMILVNGEANATINISSYGKGVRPIMNGTNNIEGNKNFRFIQFGENMLSDGSEPAKAANNIRVLELETTLDDPNNGWYPFEIKVIGSNIKMWNIKCSNGGTWEHGFFWYVGPYEAPMNVDRKLRLYNIETSESKFRHIKIESGWFKGYNIKSTSTQLQAENPVSFSTHPNCELHYCNFQVDDHMTSGFGMQIRANNHLYNFCYAKGLNRPMTVYFLSDVYNIDTNVVFDNILLEDSKTNLSYFGRASGTTKIANNVKFLRIDNINSENGMQVAEDATNTTIGYSNLSKTNGIGVRIFSGSGTKIENCTIVDNVSSDINTSVTTDEIRNSIYVNVVGNPAILDDNSSNVSDFVDRDLGNYRILKNSLLIGSAPKLVAYSRDLDGKILPSTVTKGAYEYKLK